MLSDQTLDDAVVLVELVALRGSRSLVCTLLRTDILVVLDEFLPSIVLGTALSRSGAVDLGPGSILQSQLAWSALVAMTSYEFSLGSLVCLLCLSKVRLELCLVRLLWSFGASVRCGRSCGVGHGGRSNRSQTLNRSKVWKGEVFLLGHGVFIADFCNVYVSHSGRMVNLT